MARQKTQIISTVVRGALHKAKDMPCQDYCRAKTKGVNTVAVVSDGAGSARYGKTGARIVCDTLCDLLVNARPEDFKQKLCAAIETARDKLIFHRLNKSKSENDLLHFSATLVGVYCHKNIGVFFHIGDGAGIAYQEGNYADLVISEPENGAFSCETYFYTMTDWQDCLRLVEFKDKNRILLMTDGTTGYMFSDDFYKVRRNFFVPIVEYLEREQNKTYAVKALQNTLNDSKAQRLNADDKTFLWVKRP
ncbi:MAG: protein phosphatase 2C domain-containing protein [Alphaproteobacteria bacterium]|nr:protein phosphatase 2C domain-containing protein [Alphaproteobacteria bacterium]